MCFLPSNGFNSSEASSCVRPACAGTRPGSLPRIGLRVGAWLGSADQRQRVGTGPHRTLPPARPGAEGGPPLYLQKEAVPGGCGGLGSREQGRADWRELAATGCCPSGAGRAPGVRLHCEPPPPGPGWRTWPLPRGSLCARGIQGKWVAPLPPGPAAPGESGQRVGVLLAVGTADRARRQEGSQIPPG